MDAGGYSDFHRTTNPSDNRTKTEGRWTIYRVARGSYAYAAPGVKGRRGTLVTTAVSKEAAQRICRELARDDLHPQPTTPYRSRRKAAPARGGRRTAYRCGHPTTPENTYRSGAKRRCRTCRLEAAKRRYHATKKSRRAS